MLAAMLVPLAFIAFWPSPIDQPVQDQLAAVLDYLHHHGIPAWFNYKFVEASANIGLFVPLGIVSSLAFPEKQWWQIGAFGLLISGFMELGQLLVLHDRFASPIDLVTNTSGAVIGALLAGWALKRVEARHPAVADL
ncbi:VanZ family protein [Paenarthrobacter sp. NEAU-H11]|uniref:VanZ family protein n=1 Tax=Paenarthrobacter sp. NEAU-H11 TaxID=3423924 RepID=UPI003D32D23C